MSDKSNASQTGTVTVDRACVQCSYNLRGQSAAWDRSSGRWRTTCPECGVDQPVTLDLGSGTGTAVPPYILLALGLLALACAWQLLRWAAFGQTWLMNPIDTVAYQQAIATGARPGAGAANYMIDSLDEALIHIAIAGTRLFLCGAGIGLMSVLAVWANNFQRTMFALALLTLAWLVGLWMYFAGITDAGIGDPTLSFILALQNRGGTGAAPAADWQWMLVFAVSGLLILLLGGRVGLALARPVSRKLVAMFVPPDVRASLNGSSLL